MDLEDEAWKSGALRGFRVEREQRTRWWDCADEVLDDGCWDWDFTGGEGKLQTGWIVDGENLKGPASVLRSGIEVG